MTLDGSFAIANGRWSSSEMREKLESFSRHAEGQPEEEDAGSAVTNLKGTFVLKDGVIHFSNLTFSRPRRRGTSWPAPTKFTARKSTMQGHLRMQAKLSQTVTGAKSFFLKADRSAFSPRMAREPNCRSPSPERRRIR